MLWQKKGLIFAPPANHRWMTSHAAVPTTDLISDDVLRIYFGPRDSHGRTLTTFVDLETSNPSQVLYQHDEPVLNLGQLGAFDDSGVMPSCIVTHAGRKYLFYIGWNTGVTVPYRNAIGLAVSEDGGSSFQRVCEGPVVDRNQAEPYFTTSAFVMVENQIWRMWYTSATGWRVINSKPEPSYTIKYAESLDAIHWKRENHTCIPYKFDGEAITRPWVIRENGLYKMWYSFRNITNYRTDRNRSYRIGYAESDDGLSWVRKDAEAGIDVAGTGWDSEMVTYPCIYQGNELMYMFYNGNGFGRSGFGYAIREDT